MESARNQKAALAPSKREAEAVFSQAANAQTAPQAAVDGFVSAEGQDQQHAANLEPSVLAPGDDVSRYCPVCAQRLESRRCKLICSECGYYMSCADYY